MQLLTLGLRLNEFGAWLLRGLKPTFEVNLLSSVVTGTSKLFSFVRGSADATVIDFEGITRVVKADEVRFFSTRRVENMSAGFDITQYGTINANPALAYVRMEEDGIPFVRVTCDGNTFTFSDSDNPIAIGTEVATRYAIRWVTGTPAQLQLSSGVFGDFGIQVIPTFDLLVYGSPGTVAIAEGYAAISVQIAPQAGAQFDIFEIQTEDTAGQANKTPSESVSVSAGTEADIKPDIFDAGEWDSVGQDTADRWTHNTTTGEFIITGITAQPALSYIVDINKPLRDSGLYAVTYTISDLVGTVDFTVYLGLSAGPARNTEGTFTDVLRLDDIYTDQIYFETSASTGESGTVVINSIKEIQHGTNVDGVKCFSGHNPNILTDDIIVEHAMSASAEDNIEQIADPDFDTDYGSLDDSPDWFHNFGTAGSISGGQLILPNTTSFFSGTYVPESGKLYLIDYEISTSGFHPDGISFGDEIIPQSVGKHTIVIAVTAADAPVFVAGKASSVFEYFRVLPLGNIPDSKLKGYFGSPLLTNLVLHNTDMSNIVWTPVGMSTVTVDAEGQSILIPTAATSAHTVTQDITVLANDSDLKITLSVENAGYDFIQVSTGGLLPTTYANFELIGDGAIGNSSGPSVTILKTGPGKYLLTFAVDNQDAGVGTITVSPMDADYSSISTSYLANGVDGVKVSGLTAHENGGVCLPIPTTTSTIIKPGDELIYSLPSEFVGVSDYTLVLEAFLFTHPASVNADDNQTLLEFGDGVNNKIKILFRAASGDIRFTTTHAGNGYRIDTENDSKLYSNGKHRLVGKYDSTVGTFGTLYLWVDGFEMTSILHGALPVFLADGLVNVSTSSALTGGAGAGIRDVQIFNEALSDSACMELSQL